MTLAHDWNGILNDARVGIRSKVVKEKIATINSLKLEHILQYIDAINEPIRKYARLRKRGDKGLSDTKEIMELQRLIEGSYPHYMENKGAWTAKSVEVRNILNIKPGSVDDKRFLQAKPYLQKLVHELENVSGYIKVIDQLLEKNPHDFPYAHA